MFIFLQFWRLVVSDQGSAILVSGKGSLLNLQTATFSLCLHMSEREFLVSLPLFYLGEGGRGRVEGEKILSRLPAHTQHRAQPHNPEIMTSAEIKSGMLIQLSHPGVPVLSHLKKVVSL